MIGSPKITDIFCIGIGGLRESSLPIFQVALLLNIAAVYKVNLIINDPIFTTYDIQVLQYFNIKIVIDNLKGKYKVAPNQAVIFYLPYCYPRLLNNLLSVNWNENLKNSIIISETFEKVLEAYPAKMQSKYTYYVQRVLPYISTVPLKNIDNYYGVFNKSSVHFIPGPVESHVWEAKPKAVKKK